MDAWAIGVEKALEIVVAGMESVNGATAQLGLDRLHARAEMSEDLGPTLPNAFAEAAQEGVAKAWRKRADQATRNGVFAVMQPLMEDHAWIFAIISKQDEWSKICVEEAVRMMAATAARAHPHLSARHTLALDVFLSTASGFFTALLACDKLSRVAEIDDEAMMAVGKMLSTWGVDDKSAGIWGKVPGLATLFADPNEVGAAWPASAGIRASTIQRALLLASQEVQEPRQEERSRPLPRR